MAESLTLSQFRAALEAGGLESVAVKASGGEFFVTAKPRSGGHVTLATTHGLRKRGFRDAGKAIAVLHEMGAHKVQVDTSAWSPEKAAKSARKRPDTAERQRRAHEAAAHDAWFRAQVAEAIREAARPDAVWIPHEEVVRESRRQEAEWRKKAGR